ncbi:MAG: NAD(P)/FAD-dependent oxidoreductase, partial [Gammaproteobacteria bacterium]|nr:NAD(P)/FAD-dependent oxidoreductase [Gammaproteobacteria bacterium]
MALAETVKPITEGDAAIEAALEHAHIPTLMLALVHLTGDISHLRGDIRPEMTFLGDEAAGITPEQQARMRKHALEVLIRHRDNPSEQPPPTEAAIREMLDFLVGQSVSDDYVEFLMAELSLNGEDPYAQPTIFEVPESQRGDFQVLIIGAGMSGLLAAIRLQEAGVPFQIIEKNADVGGTWLENTYPGCRVDSANHVYSYSFRPQDWPQHFSQQEVLRSYFSGCADEYNLRDKIRFNSEVTAATFNEADSLWHVEVASADGGSETIAANAIVSAVGQLNRPKLPEIAGRERFQGISFHSAEWQHEHDLTGKRVGVIGTGGT